MSTNKHPILFILSVDTEEEWDWTESFPDKQPSVTNIEQLPAFQKICDALNIRPTYFVDYAVANNERSAATFAPIAAQANVEIGAHLHPWVNPPSLPEVNEQSSHVVNLPMELVDEQIRNLLALLKRQFGVTPTSFRTGRWGTNGEVLKLLKQHNFEIDSSIQPFYENEFFSCKGAPVSPYWPDLRNPLQIGTQRDIFEIPVSVGFNKTDFERADNLLETLKTPPFSWFRAVGFAWHSRFLRKIHLSPELHRVEDMLLLTETLIRRKEPVLHMFMHSSSLIDNPNSLLGNTNAFEFITDSLINYVTALGKTVDIQFCTVSEAKNVLKTRQS